MAKAARPERRRDARRRHPVAPEHSAQPESASADPHFRRALEERPGWVKALWRTPARRLALSAVFVAIAAWMLSNAISNPAMWFDGLGGFVGFLSAPLLLVLFGAQAGQALRDLVRGQNSFPIFQSLSWKMDRNALLLVGGYLLITLPLALWLAS